MAYKPKTFTGVQSRKRFNNKMITPKPVVDKDWNLADPEGFKRKQARARQHNANVMKRAFNEMPFEQIDTALREYKAVFNNSRYMKALTKQFPERMKDHTDTLKFMTDARKRALKKAQKASADARRK